MIALSAWTLVMGHRVAVPLSILVSINPVGRNIEKTKRTKFSGIISPPKNSFQR